MNTEVRFRIYHDNALQRWVLEDNDAMVRYMRHTVQEVIEMLPKECR